MKTLYITLVILAAIMATAMALVPAFHVLLCLWRGDVTSATLFALMTAVFTATIALPAVKAARESLKIAKS